MMRQECTITDWRPTMNPNGSHGHWATQKKKHDVDRDTAWASAKHAGWKFIPGRVKLTITLVYSKKPLPDIDNCYAKVKGLIDGLKCQTQVWFHDDKDCGEFFTDDSPEWLDLSVTAVMEPGVKATRLVLESTE